MLRAAVWTHGNAARIESQSNVISAVTTGEGLVIDGTPGTETWIHFPMATPVVLNDRRQTVAAIFVLYQTRGAYIHSVHLWDGATRVANFLGPGLVPFPEGYIDAGERAQLNQDQYLAREAAKQVDARFELTARNTFSLNPIEVLWGLNIAVGVRFERIAGSGEPDSWIRLSAAGADFVE